MQAFLERKKPSTQQNKSSDVKQSQTSLPWVEKYRPRTVDDVSFQEEVVTVLKKVIHGSDLPNLLFYGPPGTGKTSTILAACRELFGDMFRSRVLELNASDERGIQVVREKVKQFAQLTAGNTRPDGKSCPPFKVIILDEADSMTSSAQAALRRIMEQHSKTTRFCLICNYVSRIIEPLTSRCSKFRFKPLSQETVIARLSHICDKEGVQYDNEALTTLEQSSEGDLRKAITTLQSAFRLKGDQRISASDILEISGFVHQDQIDGLLKICETNSYEKLQVYVKDLIAEGYSVAQVFKQVHKYVVDGPLSDKQKAAISEHLAICDYRLSDGASEYIQLMDFCASMMYYLHTEV